MEKNTTNIDGVKGKISKLNKLPLNTKLLIGILGILIIGGGIALAAPSIKEAQQQKQQREAAEALFGKKQVQQWEDMMNGKPRKR